MAVITASNITFNSSFNMDPNNQRMNDFLNLMSFGKDTSGKAWTDACEWAEEWKSSQLEKNGSPSGTKSAFKEGRFTKVRCSHAA